MNWWLVFITTHPESPFTANDETHGTAARPGLDRRWQGKWPPRLPSLIRNVPRTKRSHPNHQISMSLGVRPRRGAGRRSAGRPDY
jgi:hypothetical protein